MRDLLGLLHVESYKLLILPVLFFFQAEGGIRDVAVTGVQACALPISKLTADIGLRWEFYPPATPVQKGGFSNYDPSNNTLRVSGYGSIPNNQIGRASCRERV